MPVLAPIQVNHVALEVGVGSPIPVSLRIEGDLLDACAQLSEVKQQVVGRVITITLGTAQTSQVECRNAAGSLPFVMNWPLNAVALEAGDYQVVANGTRGQFTWPAEPTQPTDGNSTGAPGASDEAVRNVQYVLGQQLGLPEADVQLVAAEPREFSDSCLGLGYANEMCAMAITPGFVLTFTAQANGQSGTYVVHTDPAGNRFRLASAPEPQIGQTLITWSGPNDVEVGSCGQAIIGTQGVAFGDCFGKLMGGRYINNARQNDVAEAITLYAPFELDSSAGQIKFNGKGTAAATSAQQRQITEWAKQLFLEARAGRTSAALGQVVQLDQTSGQTCTTVAVHITGEVLRGNCDGSGTPTTSTLTDEQLTQLYTWVDTFGVFETSTPDRLSFGGRGGQTPTEADQQAIKDFLAGLK